MTDPKVEQWHWDAAREWMAELAGKAYAVGLAQGEQEGIRKGLERARNVVCPDGCGRGKPMTPSGAAHDCGGGYSRRCAAQPIRRALEELGHE